jgi:hypothetical protein
MLQLTCTIGTYITETRVIAIAAVIGLIVGFIELHKSIKISCSLAETSIIVDYNKWTSEYNKCQTFDHAARVLNVLEIIVKSVKRGIYPYEAYKSSFLSVTFLYFYRLELAHYKEKRGDTVDFKNDCANFAKVLWPVFEIYAKRVDQTLGTNRTDDSLKTIKPPASNLDKSESRSLKYKIKYPRLYKLYVASTDLLPNPSNK